ncbi:MAG TPA: HD domain-containing phosphohydrolase [Candidatus Competibacteraceae bacterium]|nr:HD domain-containing phosphohydrolase [Candidatus Competibacteraceae bacterium]HRZ05171.1 HD domain-containing phosphohydrolase [Candidatus Competibacteraceae bacterium]HSA46829.1 HD domain-containing phosphohydrolase [Candidatus Competibacteraceae bacterium]
MHPSHSNDPLQRLEQLNRIGIALSKERDTSKLLETILIAAKTLLYADGGTLYRLEENDQQLRFEVLYNDSLQLHMGGTTGTLIPFPPIPLYDATGQPNASMVVTYAVLNDTTVVIDDAYAEQNFDFSGTHRFDQQTGYRSRSFLTVPMKNHEDHIIGVFQLINALDPGTRQVRTFSAADRQLAESLASQAAIALTNHQLIQQLKNLFEALIALINTAIDHKSPYTGAHCQRVPILTMMIAEAAQRSELGLLKDFRPAPEELYELKIAGLLHDCGKITTPVHVVDKATKLETIFDRIHLVDTRFEVLKRDAEIEFLKEKLAAVACGDSAAISTAEQQLAQCLAELEADREFVRRNNTGGEFMDAAAQKQIRRIAARRWVGIDGQECDFLSEDEIRNLCISRGTLNPDERTIIEEHVALTMRMLDNLPWPATLRNVPEYAGCHHERLDGRGYHRGLSEAALPLPTRIICLADVFEALTARDRPYKPGKMLSEVLTILGRMVQDHQIDADLFNVFVREGVWMDYARQYLLPDQIDAVDLNQIPGYSP